MALRKHVSLIPSPAGGLRRGEGREPDPDGGDMIQSTRALPEIAATNAFYYYRDVEAAWEFYTRTLGFATVADYGFAKILQVGPTSYLTLVDETEGMHSSSEPKSVTMAVISEEVEGWWDYLSGLGVEMRAGLGNEEGVVEEGRPHDGFVAIDPEGYFLEFERFNPHPENEHLLPVLKGSRHSFPQGQETAPGVFSTGRRIWVSAGRYSGSTMRTSRRSRPSTGKLSAWRFSWIRDGRRCTRRPSRVSWGSWMGTGDSIRLQSRKGSRFPSSLRGYLAGSTI